MGRNELGRRNRKAEREGGGPRQNEEYIRVSKAGWSLEGSRRDKIPVCLKLSTGGFKVKLERKPVPGNAGYTATVVYLVLITKGSL